MPDDKIFEFYVDSRGVQWWVWHVLQIWGAQPVKDAYGVKGGKATRAVVSASDKSMLFDAIEDFGAKHTPFPWWLLIVGYLLLKKGR